MEKATLFAFNDFHRRLQPFADGTGGAARLVGRLRELKEQNPGALIANVGDVAGDNRLQGPNHFKPIPELFNRAGVDILALGNHELEDPTYNYQNLRKGLIEPFGKDVLCANVRQKDSGQLLEGTQPYTIKQLAGYSIAFIGVVTQDLSSRMFPMAGYGLQAAGIEDTLQELVPQLRDKVDAVVVLGHEGVKGMVAATQSTPGVDVTLAAHDHKRTSTAVEVVRPDGSKGYVSEAGAYGQTINQIDLYFDPESRKLMNVVVTNHRVDESCPSDPVAEEIVRTTPTLERAPRPEPVKQPALRLNSFAELGHWYNRQS